MSARLNDRSRLGQKGENLVRKFFRKKGFRIITQNFHSPRWGEIDLIIADRETLIFVEVKSRKGDQRVSALEAITPQKIRAVKRTAQYFIKQNQEKKLPQAYRLDAVTVKFFHDNKKPEIKWYRNIESFDNER